MDRAKPFKIVDFGIAFLSVCGNIVPGLVTLSVSIQAIMPTASNAITADLLGRILLTIGRSAMRYDVLERRAANILLHRVVLPSAAS